MTPTNPQIAVSDALMTRLMRFRRDHWHELRGCGYGHSDPLPAELAEPFDGIGSQDLATAHSPDGRRSCYVQRTYGGRFEFAG